MNRRLMLAVAAIGAIVGAPTAQAFAEPGNHDLPVPAPVGGSVEFRDSRATVNSEPRKRFCPEGYQQVAVTVRIDSESESAYQCLKK